MSNDARNQVIELNEIIETKKDDIALMKAEMKVASRKIERLLKSNPELAAEFAPTLVAVEAEEEAPKKAAKKV